MTVLCEMWPVCDSCGSDVMLNTNPKFQIENKSKRKINKTKSIFCDSDSIAIVYLSHGSSIVDLQTTHIALE